MGLAVDKGPRQALHWRQRSFADRHLMIMPSSETNAVPEKDLPLRDDIRLLGRILGDTVREQQGAETFAIVEHIRQTSVRFHRTEDGAARLELEATLTRISPAQALT